MDLRRKLDRLAARTPATGKASIETTTTPTDAEISTSSNATVTALRAKLDALLDRSRAKRAAAIVEQKAIVRDRLSKTPLPFDATDTPLGALHVRTIRHAKNARVGRIDIDGAIGVRSEDLALLALDATLAGRDPSGALYLDTETTGLSGGTGTLPFLIGLAWFEDGALVVEQLLLRGHGEESPMLTRLSDRIARASMLVTFNGKAFDMPLLRTRYVMNRIAAPKEPPHLDLVHVARRIHRAVSGAVAQSSSGAQSSAQESRWMERIDDIEHIAPRRSCKLVVLERALLGFERQEDIASSDIPARFAHFIRTGDPDAIVAVCDHNAWDVVSMAALVAIYGDAVARLDDAAGALEGEPTLDAIDLVGVAKTLARAGDRGRARKAADRAIHAYGGNAHHADAPADAHRVRSDIARKGNDLRVAIDDLEHLSKHHDDAAARLQLAKLYEHRLRDPARAIAQLDAGVDEPPDRIEHRRTRLQKKLVETSPQTSLPIDAKPKRR